MPKIPLYEQKTQLSTAKGVTFDLNLGQDLIDAQTASEKAVTEGVYKIMQETAKVGGEYLKRKEEQRLKELDHGYTLFENELPSEVERIKDEAREAGLNEVDAYSQKVKPYIEQSLDAWQVRTGYRANTDIQQRFEIKRDELDRKELLYVEGIQNAKAVDTGVKASQLAYNASAYTDENTNPYEKAHAVIDGLDMKEEEKQTAKTNGIVNSYNLQLNNASDVNAVNSITDRAKLELDAGFIDTPTYNKIVSTAKAYKRNLYNEVSSPAMTRLETKIIIEGTLDENDADFKLLDEGDQAKVRAQYARTDYNSRTTEEKQKSSESRRALLLEIGDDLVDEKNLQDNPLYQQMLPLDQDFVIYDIRNRRRDRESQEQKVASELKTQEEKEAFNQAKSEIASGEFDPETNKFYLDASPVMQAELNRLIDIERQETISRSEFVAQSKGEEALGYEALMNQVANFVSGLSPRGDGSAATLDELKTMHDGIIAELFYKVQGGIDKGDELYTNDIRNYVIGIMKTLSMNTGESVPSSPSKLMSHAHEGTKRDVELEAFVIFMQEYNKATSQFETQSTGAKVYSFAAEFNNFFTGLKTALKDKDNGLVKGKDDQGYSVYTNKDAWIADFVKKQMRRIHVQLSRRHIEQAVTPSVIGKTDEQVMDSVTQSQYQR